MSGSLRGMLALPVIANGVVLRSRIVPVPAGGAADFVLDPSEYADYVLIFGLRAPGMAGKLTYAITNPSLPGVYDVVSDDDEIVLGFYRGTAPTIHFVSSAAGVLNVQVHMAMFSRQQLGELRCWLNLPSTGVSTG